MSRGKRGHLNVEHKAMCIDVPCHFVDILSVPGNVALCI